MYLNEEGLAAGVRLSNTSIRRTASGNLYTRIRLLCDHQDKL